MFSNEQTACRFGGPGRSSPTIPRKKRRKKKVDRDVNVFQRILENQVGNEKVADV